LNARRNEIAVDSTASLLQHAAIAPSSIIMIAGGQQDPAHQK
jgi:hypothetical protein